MGKRLWETCMTLNDTWGYKHFDQNWKQRDDVSPDYEILRERVETSC
jgi:hypothetical protein